MMRQWLLALFYALLLTACDQQEEQAVQPVQSEQPAAIDTAPQAQPVPQAPVAAPVPQAGERTATSHLLGCENIGMALPNFMQIEQQLKEAAQAKDLSVIAPMIADNIKFDFGGGAGKAAFMAEWGLDRSPASSDFWIVLREMLAIGGYAQQGTNGGNTTVIYPCTFKQLPPDNWISRTRPEFSAYDYKVVIADNAELSDLDGNLLRMLERGETLIINPADGVATTHDGLQGYATESDLRSPIDYRMFVQQQGGYWQITLFITGD